MADSEGICQSESGLLGRRQRLACSSPGLTDRATEEGP